MSLLAKVTRPLPTGGGRVTLYRVHRVAYPVARFVQWLMIGAAVTLIVVIFVWPVLLYG